MKYIATIIFLCMITAANAQTINPSSDTVKWVYNNVTNVLNGESLSKSGSLTSYGGSRFVWEQSGMSTAYEFTSSSSTSTWTSATSDGQLESASSCNGVSGTVKISRSGNDITIELNFEQPGKLTPHLILAISSFSKI